MRAKSIMLLGTGSDVGKSLVAAGLARALTLRGLSVMPFKPQNMSNNAAVTIDGGEIGRAQALQARAARQPASVHMNPILLKPESSSGAQVIVQGKRAATLSARQFFATREHYMPAILDSFDRVSAKAELVIVEGAGSPAEINLRAGDLANLGFALQAQVPCLLVGDIHRGGVIASIVGTVEVLSEDDRKHIKGFLINKFHGDPKLFDEGLGYLEKRTGLPCLGIIPHFEKAHRLPAEDAVALEGSLSAKSGGGFKVCVLRLPRIANFDDLDPLRLTPGIDLNFLQAGLPIPGDTRLVIIPGSKSTMADLAALRASGWDVDIVAHVRRGGHVLGLCGGYQMMGRSISDPDGVEGPVGRVEGLGLLDVETVLSTDKTLTRVTAHHVASGEDMAGYEIHLGRTTGTDTGRPFAMIGNQPDGASSADGRCAGTYIHGCFSADGFRQAYLSGIGASPQQVDFEATIEQTLDELAAHVSRHIDLDRLLAIAEQGL